MKQRPSKKRPGKPRTTGPVFIIGTRLHLPFLTALDRYIAEHGGTMSRPAAIRAILATYFKL